MRGREGGRHEHQELQESLKTRSRITDSCCALYSSCASWSTSNDLMPCFWSLALYKQR